jgi:hypothetical protein
MFILQSPAPTELISPMPLGKGWVREAGVKLGVRTSHLSSSKQDGGSESGLLTQWGPGVQIG